MNRLTSLKKLLAAAIVAAGLLSFGNAAAEAGVYGGPIVADYVAPVATCHTDIYVPTCTYKTVTDWEIRSVEYVDYVTQYTSCGHPYQVQVVRTKLVKVPVQRLVKVCY
jgi:hypothetical protein